MIECGIEQLLGSIFGRLPRKQITFGSSGFMVFIFAKVNFGHIHLLIMPDGYGGSYVALEVVFSGGL